MDDESTVNYEELLIVSERKRTINNIFL